MYSLKPIARPAAILMKSTLLMGLLAAASVTTAHDAAAAGGCPVGQTRYHHRCMSYVHKRMLEMAARNKATPTPMCPMTLPITRQVVNVPCAPPAQSTGKTCPFQVPISGKVVQIPC